MRITKNKTYSKLTTLASVFLLIALVFLVAISCSSHSVRDIRASKGEKKSKKKQTTTATYEPRVIPKDEMKRNLEEMRKLFITRATVEVDMPDMRGAELDSTGTVVVDPSLILSNWERNRRTQIKEAFIADSIRIADSLQQLLPEPMELAILEDSIPEITDSLALGIDSLLTDSIEGLAMDSLSLEVDALASDTIEITDELDLTVYLDEEGPIEYATESSVPVTSFYEDIPESLSELVAQTKHRYIPERNRNINTGFVIYVPKNLLSPSWRMTITPNFMINDSIVKMPDVVLKGERFLEKQKQSYQDYEDFLASIVSKGDYDDRFLDHEGIRADMKKRQEIYFEKYYREWEEQIAYEKWKEKWLDDKAYRTALRVAEKKELYHKAERDARDEKFRRLAAGKDTTGVYADHMKNYRKKTKKLPDEFEKPVLTVNDVPKKYKPIFVGDRKVSDIKNAVLTEQDSIQITKHHYLVDEIALNELKDSTREEHKDLIIPFPYEERTRLDSIVDGTQDFIYYYSQETKIPLGDYAYKLSVESKIENFGLNAFYFPERKPMSYEVTSLTDLINPDLYIKETTINRNMYFVSKVYPKFESEKWDFKANYQDNRAQIQQLRDEYQKYIADNGYVLDSIYMVSTTSLDGSWNFNAKLSTNRGDALKSYLLKNEFPQMSETTITSRGRGEDWNTLVALMRDRDDMPNKDIILDMMSATLDPDGTEREIRRTYKTDYKVMKDSLYPKLKKTDIAFFFHRPGMEVADSIQLNEIPGYQEALQQMRERKYWDAIDVLTEHPDYNTALCLVCMGDFEQAHALLSYLAPDADTEYLLAIVSFRLGREDEAIQHLKMAIDIDPEKALRVPKDPEMVLLVEKYNL